MEHVVKIDSLPCYDLLQEYNNLYEKGIVEYPLGIEKTYQICLNTTPDYPDDMFFGTGNLFKNWDKGYYDEQGKFVVNDQSGDIKETDFTVLCTQFRNTLFEDVYNKLNAQYNVGRIRLMTNWPRTCLSWHHDFGTHRIHYPIKTQPGCIMVFEEKNYVLNENTWYYTYTDQMHTAINASKDYRTHLVATILPK